VSIPSKKSEQNLQAHLCCQTSPGKQKVYPPARPTGPVSFVKSGASFWMNCGMQFSFLQDRSTVEGLWLLTGRFELAVSPKLPLLGSGTTIDGLISIELYRCLTSLSQQLCDHVLLICRLPAQYSVIVTSLD